MFQAHTDGVQEVFRLLGGYTGDVGVITIRHGCHKHLHLHDLARIRIHIGQLVTGKVNHQFLAGLVRVGQYSLDIFLRHKVLLQMEIELGLPVPAWTGGLVFFVQHLTADVVLRVG